MILDLLVFQLTIFIGLIHERVHSLSKTAVIAIKRAGCKCASSMTADGMRTSGMTARRVSARRMAARDMGARSMTVGKVSPLPERM